MSEKIISQDIKDTMQKNMNLYNMSVILGRAVPNAYDGQKPVQRRILYGSLKGGFLSKKQFVKCAKIVGEVLATLSPHGDQATYEALTRMSQDFTYNFVLMNKNGNLGTLGGDEPSAMRYCLTGDELLLQPDGSLLRMDQLDNNGICLDYKGNIVKYTKYFKCDKFNIKKIILKFGYSIKGSFNHPIITVNNNFELEWKKLEDISYKDKIVIKKSNIDLTNLKITENEKNDAIFWGGMISEGYISSQTQKYYRVGFSNQNKNYYDKVLIEFKRLGEVYGLNLREYTPDKTSGEVFSIDTENKKFYEYISKIGRMKCEKKHIPLHILNSNALVHKYFLQSLYEGDGSVRCNFNNKRNVWYGDVSYITKSKILAKQIQILLLNFGIRSYRVFDKRSNVISIRFSDIESLKKFTNIGFISTYKNEILSKLISEIEIRSYKNKGPSKCTIIPGLKEYIIKNCKNGYSLLNKLDISTYSGFHKNIGIINKYVNNIEIINKIKEKIEFLKDFIFVEVSSIKDLKFKKNIYSIKVDSKDHSFISSGFISHNTESKLHKNAEKYLLEDIDENAVDMVNNYDATLKEPKVLPSKFPVLLVNGAMGIAAGGISTSWPCHNIVDVCHSVITLINEPEIKTEKVIDSLLPDFPTGGIITSKNDIINAYKSGQGNFLLRAKIEEDKHGNLIITEVPYSVSIEQLFESIVEACKAPPKGNIPPKIIEIKDIRDESTGGGVHLKILLKKDVNPETVKEKLYKYTKCECTYKVMMIATNKESFKLYNVKSILLDWINFRKATLKRIYNNKIKNISLRIHILEGLIMALASIDDVIKIIKSSKSYEDARDKLQSKFKDLTKIQAEYILNLKLSQLTKLENEKLISEKDEKKKLLEEYYEFVLNDSKILEYIKKEQRNIINDFKKVKRKTQILEIKSHGTKNEDKITGGSEIVEDKNYIIGISKNNLIVKIDPSNFKSQKKGGQGKQLVKSKKIENLEKMIQCNNKDYLFVFSNLGKLYYQKVWDIQEGNKNIRSIKSYVKMKEDEDIAAIIPVSLSEIEKSNGDLLFVTNKGIIKRTPLKEYTKFNRSSIIAIKLKPKHKLISVELVDNEKSDIIVVTQNGMSCRVQVSKIPIKITRNSSGVGLMRLDKNDKISNISIYNKKTDKNKRLVVLTKKGIGKKQLIKSLRRIGRFRKGYKIISLNDNKIIRSKIVDKTSDLLVTTKNKSIRIKVSGLKELKSRLSKGYKFIKIEPDNEVIDFEEILN